MFSREGVARETLMQTKNTPAFKLLEKLNYYFDSYSIPDSVNIKIEQTCLSGLFENIIL